MKAVISFGSNINPEANLPAALAMLRQGAEILAVSAVYQTPPVGNPNDPPFLNAAVLIETELLPAALRGRLRRIEAALGRKRTADPNAPRTIDLDILLYEGEPPDSDLYKYPHAAIPAAEVAGDWRLPEGKTVSALAAEMMPAARQFYRKEIRSWG